MFPHSFLHADSSTGHTNLPHIRIWKNLSMVIFFQLRSNIQK